MRFPCVDATGTKVWSERRGDLAEAASRANLFLRSSTPTKSAGIHVIWSKPTSLVYKMVFDTTVFHYFANCLVQVHKKHIPRMWTLFR